MEEVKVTRNYQITIPSTIRAKLNIRVGDKLLVYVENNKIIIEKKSGNITSLNLKLGRKFTDEDINKIIAEAGEEIGRSSS
ncbi:AbrB/MazE/SpoVT family DNA-binding domain-containing protein [Sulfurisphaera ohwakuensis]|uniref:AbrB family looped-hinge helix DNA binding protein n=1 Tax=Sulfurisphaera ohwakuensis TaxID=69656 RepID=A0A650CI05_SULOH|nr:AbrB/MazE/SpoVT family DNA-binding domain-containing protein [Sulfurisphaera ohwakuensis]MBB5254901.1 AbrB family looped-hinge helix DNA binding protein [Sulfurisphaera ohwakuensis]QGR17484.1 AbrB/MazE/SpoVT family DNA-binding domain-containing protein [Sulfurisphaera ohwakuensis]